MDSQALPGNDGDRDPLKDLHHKYREHKEFCDRLEADTRMAMEIARVYGIREADRPDKAQDLFLGLLEAGKLTSERIDAERWYARGAAWNAARAHWRDRNNRFNESLNAPVFDPDEEGMVEQGDRQTELIDSFEAWGFRVRQREIVEHLSRLPNPTERQAALGYLAHLITGKSINEIAADLGLLPNTLTQTARRVFKRIYRDLGYLPPEADAA